MAFDIEKIKTLIATAAQAQVDVLELSEAGVDVRIERRVMAGAQAHPAPSGAPPAVPLAGPSHAPAAPRPAQAPPPSSPLHIVRADMAGTFYRAVTPGGEPLVQQGAQVEPGAVLGVLESMKMMNEIGSELRATVERIVCEDGQQVSAGQALFELKEC